MAKRIDFCLQCDEMREITEKLTKVTHKIKDEEISFEIKIPYCSVCGNQISDLEVEEHHFNLALNEYRKRKKLLFPEEIKMIREKYGLSQRAFARALGFSEPTINRYELGAVQDGPHNSIIMLVKNPDNMWLIVNQNRENLTAREINSLSKVIEELKVEKDAQNSENSMLKALYCEVFNLSKKVDRLEGPKICPKEQDWINFSRNPNKLQKAFMSDQPYQNIFEEGLSKEKFISDSYKM